MGLNRRKLVWLASYPKSGNTWLRIFLANYLLDNAMGGMHVFDKMKQLNLNDSSRKQIEELAERPLDELELGEVFKAREAYLLRLADQEKSTLIKTHQANAKFLGSAIIPPELTLCAIYVVRNPLDIVSSFADFMGMTVDDAAVRLNRNGYSMTLTERQTPQFLGTWSMHVRSWFASSDFPVQVLRYEDMLENPEQNFGSVIEAIRAPYDKNRLIRAIEASSFDKLVEQEDKAGFQERSEYQQRFFRSGKKDTWQERLPGPIVDKIREDHGEVMKFLKYL